MLRPGAVAGAQLHGWWDKRADSSELSEPSRREQAPTTGQPQTGSVTAWWHDAVVYEVYPRSFADSTGDGTGDLAGVTAHLDHLVDLGVDALWLAPFYVSPMADGGYDVADPCAVDPVFGDLAAFDELLASAHAKGLKVVVDIVPNHVSTQHPWFQAALADGDERDLFFFREQPNNWESVFTGPAWTRTTDGDWYLHLFDASQPDLDWREDRVHAEFERVLRFWLDRGVDGFRIDVAHALYKEPTLADIPLAEQDRARHGISTYNMWNQDAVLDVYTGWHALLDTYPGDRMLVGEVYLLDPLRVAEFTAPGRLHQAFNFSVLHAPFDATALQATLTQALALFDSPTWVLSNHDVVRHATRYGGGVRGVERGLALTALLLALPGSPYLYQGEELGLPESEVAPADRQDPVWLRQVAAGTTTGEPGRDGCRTPMPWTDEPGGRGFTTGSPWLPFGASPTSVQAQAGDPSSTLSVYRRLLAARRAHARPLPPEVVWVPSAPGVLHLRRGPLEVVANLGEAPADLPAGSVLVSSRPVEGDSLPPRTTAWLVHQLFT